MWCHPRASRRETDPIVQIFQWKVKIQSCKFKDLVGKIHRHTRKGPCAFKSPTVLEHQLHSRWILGMFFPDILKVCLSWLVDSWRKMHNGLNHCKKNMSNGVSRWLHWCWLEKRVGEYFQLHIELVESFALNHQISDAPLGEQFIRWFLFSLSNLFCPSPSCFVLPRS